MISPARARIHNRAPVKGSVATCCADTRPPLLRTWCAPEDAIAPGASPPAGFDPGSFGGVSCVVVAVVVTVVVGGRAAGGPALGCGCGCGSGVGEGSGPPQLPP